MHSESSRIALTIDVDWACEYVVCCMLEFLIEKKLPATFFSTHNSKILESCMKQFEVGLHPFFGRGSSHGNSESEVVHSVLELPHNLNAFRCHRFEVSNSSRLEMWKAGFRTSSNVCTDLQIVSPFLDRFRMLEVPIFLEDGAFLYQGYDLSDLSPVHKALMNPGLKVFLIHPMHFILNSPSFSFMTNIKNSTSRYDWRNMTSSRIEKIRWKHRGIRDFFSEIFEVAVECDLPFVTIGALGREFRGISE